MRTEHFIDAAISEADGGGSFDPELVSKRLGLSREQERKIGVRLAAEGLIVMAYERWRLIGRAAEMADRRREGANEERKAMPRPQKRSREALPRKLLARKRFK